MDKIDLKLLAELDQNPRASEKSIARKIGTSQQVVSYRLKRLEKIGLRCGAIINHGMLGWRRYHIFLRTNKIDETALVAYFKKKPNTYWFARVGGKWDYTLIIYVRSYADYESFMHALFKRFSLQDYDALYIPEHRYFGHGFLHDARGRIVIGEGTSQIDDLDKHILEILAENCRTSHLNIARQTGVTYKTIQNRIKAMDVIAGYRLFIASEHFGHHAYLVLIKYITHIADETLLSFAEHNEKITQASKTFGAYSMLLHIRVHNPEELQTLLNKMRNAYPIEHEIVPVFEDHKINLGLVRNIL